MVPHECCSTSPLPVGRDRPAVALRDLLTGKRDLISAATGCGYLSRLSSSRTKGGRCGRVFKPRKRRDLIAGLRQAWWLWIGQTN